MPCVQGNRCGNPESTTLLTLLPVFLSQPRAGFFLPAICLPVCRPFGKRVRDTSFADALWL
ncbi:hypothetical protein FGE25_01465 [Kosakonia sacchari]|nr:hypothetical protein FGE25_01465 [Kosakonia sacchari]